MTKIYSGDPGPPPRAYVKDGKGKPRALRTAVDPTWGNSGIGAAELAYAILADALGDENRARKFFGRFKWRVLADLKSEQSWLLTLEYVLATVADIEKTELDTATGRRMAELEPAPVVSGLAPDMAWSAEPTLKPNLPEKKP
jgi:hypothetical protein